MNRTTKFKTKVKRKSAKAEARMLFQKQNSETFFFSFFEFRSCQNRIERFVKFQNSGIFVVNDFQRCK